MTDSDLPFRATYRGNPVEIGLARDAGLAVIVGCIFPSSTRDLLDAWSLVAIRDADGHGTEVHAPGWRVALGNT